MVQRRLKQSTDLFREMKCVNDDTNNVDYDKMRCHILDCLAALRRLQRDSRICGSRTATEEQHESAKNKVYAAAIPTTMDDNGHGNHYILTFLLSPFPDKNKITDGRSWLPLSFALALGDKIEEKDVRVLHSNNQLPMQRYNAIDTEMFYTLKEKHQKYLPVHFFCRQRHPNMSLLKYLSIRDTKAFTLSVCTMYDM
jgi:hypothetical protein